MFDATTGWVDGGLRSPRTRHYDLVVDPAYPGQEGAEFHCPDGEGFRVYRSVRAAFSDESNLGKSIFVVPGTDERWTHRG